MLSFLIKSSRVKSGSMPSILNMYYTGVNQLFLSPLTKAWSPYSCNGRKHRCKHVSLFQTVLIHVNTLITTSQASIVQFLPAAMIAVTIEGMSPALSQVVLQI